MFCTSRQPRPGLASSISATTPVTIGVASDVPLKPFGGKFRVVDGVDVVVGNETVAASQVGRDDVGRGRGHQKTGAVVGKGGCEAVFHVCPRS